MRLRSEQGFTMLELLITIMIIGNLAAIGLAAYNGQRSRAHAQAAEETVHRAMRHAWTYYLENETWAGWQTKLLEDEPALSVSSTPILSAYGTADWPGRSADPNRLYLDTSAPASYGIGVCAASRGDTVICGWLQVSASDSWRGLWYVSGRDRTIYGTYAQSASVWRKAGNAPD